MIERGQGQVLESGFALSRGNLEIGYIPGSVVRLYAAQRVLFCLSVVLSAAIMLSGGGNRRCFRVCQRFMGAFFLLAGTWSRSLQRGCLRKSLMLVMGNCFCILIFSDGAIS